MKETCKTTLLFKIILGHNEFIFHHNKWITKWYCKLWWNKFHQWSGLICSQPRFIGLAVIGLDHISVWTAWQMRCRRFNNSACVRFSKVSFRLHRFLALRITLFGLSNPCVEGNQFFCRVKPLLKPNYVIRNTKKNALAWTRLT